MPLLLARRRVGLVPLSAAGLPAKGHNVPLIASGQSETVYDTASLQLEYGVKASYVSCRFGGFAEEEATLVSAVREFGSVDLLFYPIGLAEENDTGFLDEPTVMRLVRVNFLSQVNLTTALWPTLLERERAAVVGFGSIAAVRGRSRNVVYAAAKRALASYFDSLRHLAVGTNIRVHFYYLGYLDTQQTLGKALPLPRASADSLARLVMDRLDSNSGPVFYPWFWGPISWGLRCLPWFVYQRLKF